MYSKLKKEQRNLICEIVQIFEISWLKNYRCRDIFEMKVCRQFAGIKCVVKIEKWKITEISDAILGKYIRCNSDGWERVSNDDYFIDDWFS